ncbi:MAG: Mpo1-like protein [Myxococcota bacterium]
MKTITSFEAFWPFYLGEHSLPITRWFHFVGTSLALLNLVWAVVHLAPLYVVSALLSGYAFAWVSHFFLEKNRPATFTYPLWSFIADWKMWALMLTGRLAAELEKHAIKPKTAGAATAS